MKFTLGPFLKKLKNIFTLTFVLWTLLLLTILVMAAVLILLVPTFSTKLTSLTVSTMTAAAVISTLLVILTLLIILIVWFIIRNQKINSANSANSTNNNPQEQTNKAVTFSKKQLKELHDKLDRKYQKIKQFEARHQLQAAPKFIIIGLPESGKSSIIKNSGLEFPWQKKLAFEIEEGHWWFSKKAIFLENDIDSTMQNLEKWNKKVQLLKKHFKKTCWRGLVFVISVDTIISSKDNYDDLSQSIIFAIDTFYEKMQWEIPVYIIFSKSDQLLGFNEFFRGIDKDRSEHWYGIFLKNALQKTDEKVLGDFITQYLDLIKRLQQHKLFRLQQHLRGSTCRKVFQYPQQVHQFFLRLERLFKRFYNSSALRQNFPFRAFFSCSVKQAGSLFDLLNEKKPDAAALSSSKSAAEQGLHRDYFTKGIFDCLLGHELKLARPSIRLYRFQQRWRRIVLGSAIFLLTICSGAWSYSYYQNHQRLDVLKKGLSYYTHKFKNPPPKIDKKVTAQLTQLRVAQRLTTYFNIKNRHLSMRWGLYLDGPLQRAAENYYVNLANKALLPPVVEKFGQLLEHLQAARLYQALTVYLMLNNLQHRHVNVILNWLDNHWPELLQQSPAHLQQKRLILNNLFQRYFGLVDDSIPIDEKQVQQARKRLLSFSSARLTYLAYRLRALANPPDELNFNNSFGSSFNDVFQQTYPDLTIPVLFTVKGYRKSFVPFLKTQSTNNQSQDWVLGVEHFNSENINDALNLNEYMLAWYLQDYNRTWRKNIDNLSIVKLNSLKQAATVTAILIQPNSPLYKLLKVLQQNSSYEEKAQKEIGIPMDVVVTDDRLGTLTDLLKASAESPSTYQQILQQLTQLHRYLVKLTTAPNPHKAAFLEAEKSFQQGEESVVSNVLRFAQSMPAPLNRWLNYLAIRSWQLTVQNAALYINQQWQPVYRQVNQQIGGTYPFSQNASESATVTAFSQVLGKNGLIQSYTQKYIQPFIKINYHHWHKKKVEGVTLPLKATFVTQLHKSQQIKEALFREDQSAPQLRFTITPYYLSEDALRVKLALNQQYITYQHGPQLTTALRWQAATLNNRASFSMRLTSHKLLEMDAGGPWALFRLLDRASFNQNLPTATAGTSSLLTFALKGYQATFMAQSKIMSLAQILTHLHSLKFVKDIIAVPPETHKEQR